MADIGKAIADSYKAHSALEQRMAELERELVKEDFLFRLRGGRIVETYNIGCPPLELKCQNCNWSDAWLMGKVILALLLALTGALAGCEPSASIAPGISYAKNGPYGIPHVDLEPRARLSIECAGAAYRVIQWRDRIEFDCLDRLQTDAGAP